MLSSLTDSQNALLNKISYKNIPANWKSGQSLYDVISKVDSNLASELKKAGLGDYVIKDYLNNNDAGSKSGFCAIAFEDPKSGAVGMSFRGTEGMDDIINNPKDMADNLMTATVGVSLQSLEAISFFEKNENKNGNNYLYGHSKGGELAAEVFATNYLNIKGVHVINPQPINAHKLSPDQLAAFLSGKYDAVVVDGDVVWGLGSCPFPVRFATRNKDYKQGNFVAPHDIDAIMYNDDESISICRFPYLNHPLQGLTVLVENVVVGAIQCGLSGPAFAVNIGVRVVNFIINDLPDLAIKFINYVVDELEKIKNVAKGFIESVKEFANKIYTNLVNWYNTNLNAGYKYATGNPDIKVNTYLLRNYADRIASVNRRVTNLDRRIDSLYCRICSIEDFIGSARALYNLINADMLTGYSFRLQLCINYLNETATAFETVETNILRNTVKG